MGLDESAGDGQAEAAARRVAGLAMEPVEQQVGARRVEAAAGVRD